MGITEFVSRRRRRRNRRRAPIHLPPEDTYALQARSYVERFMFSGPLCQPSKLEETWKLLDRATSLFFEQFLTLKRGNAFYTSLRIKSCNDDLYLITRRSLVSTANGLSSWRKHEETMTSTRERKREVRSLNAYYAVLPAAP